VAGLTPLLAAGQSVTTGRLRIERAELEDLAHTWLAPALAPEWRLDDLDELTGVGGFAVKDEVDVTIGLGIVRPGRPHPDAVTFAFIAVDPARRYAGRGGEAALAVEALVRERWRPAELLAPVPAGRGLAVYFWLRLGYRPLTRSEAPWPLVGLGETPIEGIWMGRSAP
jgi:hypothetical protein